MAGSDRDGSGVRKLFKGRLQPPKRDLLSTTSVQPPVLKNELIVERPGAAPRPPAIEVCSTALPQPFLNPDLPLRQQTGPSSSA